MTKTKPRFQQTFPIFAILLGIAGFVWGGCSSAPETAGETESAEASEPEAVELVDSDIIPVADSPQKGAEDAWVTLVVFADFQCPFCARLAATLDEVVDQFDDGEVRMVFKHFPLDGSAETSRAALAVEAAGEQGKFWEMHDAVFDNFAQLPDDPDEMLVELAASLELDEEQFRRDMNSPQMAERIDGDQQLAQELQLTGVPAVFVNGGFISGAQPAEVYAAVINNIYEILTHGVETGEVDREDVYRSSVETLHDHANPTGGTDEPAEMSVQQIPVADERPETRDVVEAIVHIGAFLSFGDDPSLKFQRQLDEVADESDDVRVVYFHVLHDEDETVRLAHRALEGAESPAQVRELVHWLGDEDNDWRDEPELLDDFLDDHQISAVDDAEFDAIVEADYRVADDVGVYGTPTSFVNGIPLVGVPEPPELQEVVEEQLALASRIAEIKDLSGEVLYEEMVQGNQQRKEGPSQ